MNLTNNKLSYYIIQNNKDKDIYQMLKDFYNKKTIAILGYESLVSKIFIKKMINDVKFEGKIYMIENNLNKKYQQKFLSGAYFNGQQKEKIKNICAFVFVEELKKIVEESENKCIDLLFNFKIPLDFSNEEKIIENHILFPQQICSKLQKIRINHCILLSSLYYHDPGYLAQNEQRNGVSYKYNLDSPQKVKQYFNDSFNSLRQSWKWSLSFIEESFLQIAKRLDIIRLPALGPTWTNNEGYMDRFNNFIYLFYQLGSGMIRNINGVNSNKMDIIPADYVANFAIILGKTKSNSSYETFNLSTSTRNPIILQKFINFATQAWNEYESKELKVRIDEKPWIRKAIVLKQELPTNVKIRLGSMFDFKGWKIDGQKSLIEINQRRRFIEKYQYFLENQWNCESNKSIDIFNNLEPEEQEKFSFNVNHINWKVYIKLCAYSVKKYLLNHRIQKFEPERMNLLQGQSKRSYFSDIMWALNKGNTSSPAKSKEMIKYVMSTAQVKDAIKNLAQEKMLKLENQPIPYEKALEEFNKIAEQICTQMFSQYNMNSIRAFAWFLHKVFKTIYEKVEVDKNSMLKIQNHNEKQNGPIIVIPTHRSYIDFLIMSYVFFGYGVKVPHIAAAEDFLGMAVIHILLRQSGAFFIKRNQKKYKDLYKAVMNEYLTKLLSQSHYLQFFVEGTRSRVGKMLAPKYGILSVVAKNVLEGKIPDAQILPVTLNYEKVLEGNTFTYEMMGEPKVKQSLSRLIKAADVLKENYGRIYIEFCQPISVKKYFKEKKGMEFDKVLDNLGKQIVYDLTDKLVVTPPAIIASLVLMNRKGISDDSLQQKVNWLCKQISSRKIKIGRAQADSSISVPNTIALMDQIIQKSKKNMFQVQLSFDQGSFVKLFNMTYYRNTLTHIFFEEAVILTALGSFGYQKMIDKTIKIEELYKQTVFLWQLLQNEFYLKQNPKDINRFNELLKFMEQKMVIRFEGQYIQVLEPQGNYFNFCWSLIWPVVESYWITCLYLFKLQKSHIPIAMAKLLSQIQWFAQSLVSQRIILHAEAISVDTVKNAVSIFTKMKLIKNVTHEYDGELLASVKLQADEKSIKKLENKISSFLKSSYAKSVKGILDSSQGSVNLDYPFLSKL